MADTRTSLCVVCGEELPVSAFYTYTVVSGEVRCRSSCKACAAELNAYNRRARSRLSNTQLAGLGGEPKSSGIKSFKGDASVADVLEQLPLEDAAAALGVSVLTAGLWRAEAELGEQ